MIAHGRVRLVFSISALGLVYHCFVCKLSQIDTQWPKKRPNFGATLARTNTSRERDRERMICGQKFMLPKQRFWKEEQKMKCGFSVYFSMVRSPNRVLTPLKSASKSAFHLLFILPKSSFGWGKIERRSVAKIAKWRWEHPGMYGPNLDYCDWYASPVVAEWRWPTGAWSAWTPSTRWMWSLAAVGRGERRPTFGASCIRETCCEMTALVRIGELLV